MGSVRVAGGMVWVIGVNRSLIGRPASDGLNDGIECCDDGRVLIPGGRRCIGWIRILERVIRKIRVSWPPVGLSYACLVEGPWARSSRLEVASDAITCRVQKRFSSFASFLSSII